MLGVLLGVILAMMRLSPNPILTSAAWIYLWVFRGTPVYTQLVFWGLISVIYPSFGLGIPFGPEFVSFRDTAGDHVLRGRSDRAVVERVRVHGRDRPRRDPSVGTARRRRPSALGMTRNQIMRRIVLPQAMRVIIPPTGNELISMLKTTSLVVAVPLTSELYSRSREIALSLFQPVPLLICASIWYLAITSVLMVGQYYVERHYARGSQRQLPPTPMQKLRMRLSGPAAAGDPGPGRGCRRRRCWRLDHPGGDGGGRDRDRAGRMRRRSRPRRHADGARRGCSQAVRPARGAQGHRPDRVERGT